MKETVSQTDRQIGRLTNGQTDRRVDRLPNGQTDRDRHTDT